MGGREAVGGKIQWAKLEQPWFDRVVETLLTRKYRDTARVVPIDGRGGDGGIDVVVTHPDGRCVIYQLKYYAEGMSGGHRPRRTKVKNSFTRAVEEFEPHEWILVIPRNYTNPEITFLKGLSSEVPEDKRSPIIRWMGRGDLDQMLIDYPEVDQWLTLDYYRQSRLIFEHEKTAFLDSTARDLASRVAALGELSAARDPDWRWDFGHLNGISTLTLEAKHPAAAARSPISISFAALLDEDESSTQELRRAIKYGSPTSVEIAGSALENFKVTGSAIVDGMPKNPDKIILRSLPAEEVPAVGQLMEFCLFDDEPIGKIEGIVSEVYFGTEGITNKIEFHGGRLTVIVEIPADATGEESTLGISYSLGGLSPRAVADLLESYLKMRTASEVHLHIDGNFLARFANTRDDNDSEDDALRQVADLWLYAEDLAQVLGFTGRSMTFPTSFNVEDQVHARVARLLTEGHIVASPLVTGWYGTVADDASPPSSELKEMLTTREPRSQIIGHYVAPIAGKAFDLGTFGAFHPETWAENGREILGGLEQGNIGETRIEFRPGEDPYFFVYLTDVVHEREDRIHGWNLAGVDEPWLNQPWLKNAETSQGEAASTESPRVNRQ